MMKRNTPVKTLIKNYTNKKSGKVSTAKKELKSRWKYLDFADQKKIVLAFLNSCSTDREWMYPRLLDFWDDSFEQKIKELWELHHEAKCGWVVIRHLPEDYVYSQIKWFDGERNYYFICKRLINYPGFEIDKSRFKYFPNDYLYIQTLHGATIPEAEAEELLFGMLRDISTYDDVKCSFRNMSNVNVVSPIDCKEIYRAVCCIEKLNCPKTIEKFWEFDCFVARYYRDTYSGNIDNTQQRLERVLRSCIKFCLNGEYKYLPWILPRFSTVAVNRLLKQNEYEAKPSVVAQIEDDVNETWNKMKDSNSSFAS